MAAPADPAIFHITHIDNLPGTVTNIGHQHIKQRRLTRPVPVAARGMLGDYVPFNFCPRSVMLYVVNKRHKDYGRGQDEIVHLVSTVQTAIATGRPWAFTDRHADLRHAAYYDDLADLGEVAWPVMPLTWWNEPDTMEQRQAEFLVHDWLQWDAVLGIGVINDAMAGRVRSLLGPSAQILAVQVRRDWYY